MSNVHGIPPALAAFALMLLGVVAYRRAGWRLGIPFYALLAAAAIWLGTFALMYGAPSQATALIWAKIAYLAIPQIAAAAYHFTVDCMRLEGWPRKIVKPAWVAAFLFSAFAVGGNLLLADVSHYGWGYYPRYGPLGSLFFLYFIALFVLTIGAYAMGLWRLTNATERTQLKWLLVAFVGAAAGLVDYLPKFGIDVYPLGFSGALWWAGAMGLLLWREDFALCASSRSHDMAAVDVSEHHLRDLAVHLQNAREEEQQRIARDLHDVMGHLLTATRFDVAWIRHRLPEDRPDLRARLEAVDKHLDDLFATTRDVINELRPSTLEDLGFVAAVDSYLAGFGARTGLRTTLHTPPHIDIAFDRALAVFRVVQEALTNVARHAHANHVAVTLRQRPIEVVVLIEDDGVGVSVAAGRESHGLGMLGMRERLRPFGGHVAFDPRQPCGTKVVIVMPTESPAWVIESS